MPAAGTARPRNESEAGSAPTEGKRSQQPSGLAGRRGGGHVVRSQRAAGAAGLRAWLHCRGL